MDPLSILASVTTLVEGGKSVFEIGQAAAAAVKKLDDESARLMVQSSRGMTSEQKSVNTIIKRREIEAARKELYYFFRDTEGLGVSAWREMEEELKKQKVRDKKAAKELQIKREKTREAVFIAAVVCGGCLGILGLLYLVFMY